jgi:uncharacterized membrane protein
MYPDPHMIWMALGWTIGLAVMAAFLWMLFTVFGGPRVVKESAEAILKRRLAAGEIDVEEYERRVKALSKTKTAA